MTILTLNNTNANINLRVGVIAMQVSEKQSTEGPSLVGLLFFLFTVPYPEAYLLSFHLILMVSVLFQHNTTQPRPTYNLLDSASLQKTYSNTHLLRQFQPLLMYQRVTSLCVRANRLPLW